MKTKISHLGRSSVSVILAVMMLLSTMLIGTVSTVNAITTPLEEGTVVYVQVKGGGVDWYADTNNAFSAWVWGGKATKQWVQLKSVPSTDNKYFYFVVPEGGITSCLLHRKSNTMKDGWIEQTNYWNATGDITLSNTNNLITIKDWNNSFSNDSCYQTDSTAKLDADNTSVTEGTAVTFTPSLTSNTDFNDIKSVSYSVKKDSVDASSSDYSIEGSKITFNKAGNYEVTANVIYNAKGFSDITKIATATTTVMVESSLPHVAESVTLTALPETVTSGGSTKLTATLTNKATGVGNVTYTFKSGDTTVGTFENTADTTASVNVDNITSDTTYTVTVSAAEHSDVTATAKVTVKQLENWYLMGTGYGEWNKVDDKKYNLTRDPVTGFYYYDTTGANKGDVYFRFHDGEGQYCPDSDPKAIALGGEKLKITKSTNAYAFKYSNTVSNYRIWLDSSNANDIKVWITDITKKYNISNDSGKKLTISPNQASAGETVTVTATPGTGEVLKSVTVVGENGSTPIETTVSGKTATFIMPDQNVTVKEVTFREAKKYTVKFSSSDDNFGSVSAKYNGTDFTSDTKVTEGDEVTFTATSKDGYALSDWTVNGVSASSTTNPYTITVQKDTTVVANFKEVTGTPSNYYLLCGEDASFKTGSYTPVPLYKNEEGVYYADFNAADIPKDKEYYIIFSDKNDTSGIINDNSENIKITNVSVKGFSLDNYNANVQQPAGGSYGVKFAKVYINGDSDVVSFTIKVNNLDLNSKKITYSAEPKFKEAPKNAVNIIAKNGTQTAKFQNMGSTVITPVENVVFDIDSYNKYTQKATAIKGNKVTVTTTVDKAYKDTYYVKGFVVNGESYGIQSGPNDTGVYTLEYQIPDDVDDGTNFEITPVYFLKDNRNCVTFYVEGFDGAVQESWGNTIACYPYYEGVSDTNQNAFGAYPGQPLLYEGGKYYTQIPKSITLNGTVKKIVGMTLNNFAIESVHQAISTIKENKQSYDYDDFVRIANNNYGNNIIYTFKYSTVKDNFGELTESPAIITKDEFDSPTGNGWEDLTDYNHRKVDLFGNVLTDTASEKEPLLVVSNGYFENYQGFYATEWTVYELKDGTYSKIAQIPSSALLLKSKEDLSNSTPGTKYENSLSDYANAYGTLEASYKNTPAKITFERSIKRGKSLQGHTNNDGDGEIADRVDGRWYYSMIGEEITAKIAVEYGDTATSPFTKDPFEGDTNKTTTIGAHAYFTNDAASGKTTYKSNIDSSNYFTFTADTIATDEKGQNYVFLGWYLLSDDKYTKLTDAKAPMTGSDTFVARYVKAPAGTVTIDHKLFSAASNPTPTPTPGTGSGKCFVTVKVFDKTTGKFVKTFAETEKSVTLDGTYINSAKNYELQITLRTVTSGQDKFEKFYYLAQNKQTYNSIDAGTTTTPGNVTTVTRKVDIRGSFFNYNADDGTYTFKNKTGSDSIHYYSDITETKIPYKITFNYEPRLESDAKQYVVTGEFTSEYILKYGAVLTKEFVMSVAPYEDNFFNTIKWDKDNITIDNKGTTKTAEIKSTTSRRTVTVKALNADGTPIEAYKLNNVPENISTVFYGKLLTYDNLCGLDDAQKKEIANGRGKYIYVAKPEYDGKKFSYWQISTSSDMANKSAYVTKCFSQEFNYIAYNNYYIWPVYGKSQSITGASTTLNFLDYSRNQSTDPEGGSKTDRVFADFALAFDSNGIQLQTYKGDNIKVGMFLEVCGDLETDSNGDVITDIDHYKNMPEYSTTDEDLDSIKAAILKDSTIKNINYTTKAGKNRWLLNKPIDIKSLDNKNRIEYYVGYNNNDNNQKKLMRAYSYVIVDNEITLCSTPYSFVNYYKVGNKTYTVS